MAAPTGRVSTLFTSFIRGLSINDSRLRYCQRQYLKHFFRQIHSLSYKTVMRHSLPEGSKWAIIREFCETSNTSRARKLVLGIETSCDDTGVAVVDDGGVVVGEALHSQTEFHVQLGGINPNIARDLHKKNIAHVVSTALQRANVAVEDVDAIATTVKPGLSMSLAVGLDYTKSLIEKYRKPFIPVHHMEAHALTVRMVHKLDFPFLVLLVSGGHALLAVARAVDDFLLIGKSLDIAPGDVFDKVSRRLKLPNVSECRGMSGGQSVEHMAEAGDPHAFTHKHYAGRTQSCDFSFAGMETDFLKIIVEEELKYGTEGGNVVPSAPDICASFQYNILYHLAKRIQRALIFCEMEQLLPMYNKTLVISGGVASNQFLRHGLQVLCEAHGCQLVCPPPKLCTDNGIMIAWNGMEKLKMGVGITDDIETITIQPKCPLGSDIREEVVKRTIKLRSVKQYLKNIVPAKF